MYFPSVYRRTSTCLASWHLHRRSGSVCQQRFGMTWRGLSIFYQHLLHCPLSRLGWYFDIGYSGNVTNILCTGMVVLPLYTCMLWLSWKTWGFSEDKYGSLGTAGRPACVPTLHTPTTHPGSSITLSVCFLNMSTQIFSIWSHGRRWVWAVEELRFTRLTTKLFFWTRQTFRFLYLFNWHILTKAIISANHMWLRTGMAGRILLKLVSELKISWNSTIKKSMELLMKEDQHVRNAFYFAGVATAYTLLQLSSSLQLMSTVRFSFSDKIWDSFSKSATLP